MSCIRNLRTDFKSDADAGGVWVYIGHHSTSPSGPWNQTPGNPLVGVPAGTQLVGDDPTVDSDASNGFYRFSYTVNNGVCDAASFLTIEVKTASCAGDDFTLEVCSNSPTFSLATAYDTATSCDLAIGTIAGVSGSPTIGSAPNYNFSPATNGAGTFVVRNTVNTLPSAGFTVDCETCTQTADATIVVLAFRSAGDERFIPYFSICTSPTCSVSLPDLLLNLPVGSQDGDWWIRPAGTGFPAYTDIDLTINTNLYPNVTSSFTPNTQITNNSVSGTLNFSAADPGFVYNFEYIVGDGTPCETSTFVQVYVGPIPDAGTAPSPETLCYEDLSATVMNLYDQLTGASTQGTWAVSSSPSRPLSINLAWDQGSTDPLFVLSGTDDEFDFQTFRDTAKFAGNTLSSVDPGSSFTFTFQYTAQLPSSYLCAACVPDSISYQKTVVFTYDTGTTTYDSPENAYVIDCENPVFDLFDLISGEEEGGVWRVPPAYLVPTATTITNVGRPQTADTATLIPGQQIYPVGFTSPLQLDFTNVPYGTYAIMYQGGTFPLPAGADQCPRNTVVYVTWECGCEFDCDGARSIMLLRHDTGESMSAGTGQIRSFIVDGVEQLLSPVNFSTLQNTTITGGSCTNCPGGTLGTLYNAAVLNALDGLAIPGFDFEQPTNDELRGIGIPSGYVTCNEKYVKVKAPMCIDWTIVIANVPGDTNFDVTWQNTGGTVTVTSPIAPLGVNTVPNNPVICTSGSGNNYIPIGSDDLCP